MKYAFTAVLIFCITILFGQEWKKVYQYIYFDPLTESTIDNFQFINSEVGYFSTYEFTPGSSPGYSELYMTNNSGTDWRIVYTLEESTMGASAALHFDFIDERNFFMFESLYGGLCYGKKFCDSIETSIGFTPYTPFIKFISPDTVIITNFTDESCLYILPTNEDILYKIPITGKYVFAYPTWYNDYDLIKSASFVKGFGAAIGTFNGLNFLYTSNSILNNWTRDTLNIDGELNKTYFINDSIGFIFGNDTEIYRTQNRGIDWIKIEFPVNFDVIDIQFCDSTGYIIGSDGIVVRSDNYGKDWIIDSVELAGDFKNLSVVDDIAYIVDVNDQVFTNNPDVSNRIPATTAIPINYYPNPVSELLIIDAPKTVHEISIYNKDGQLVVKKANLSNTPVELNVCKLPKGIYISKVICEDIIYTFKIIKI